MQPVFAFVQPNQRQIFCVAYYCLIWVRSSAFQCVVSAPLNLGNLLVCCSSSLERRRDVAFNDDVTPRNAEKEAAAGTVIAFSIFFWVLIAMAAVALFAHYM